MPTKDLPEEVEFLLCAYADGECDADAAARARTLVEGDPAAAEYLSRAQTDRDAYVRALLNEMEGIDVSGAVISAVREHAARSERHRREIKWRRVTAPLAAAALLTLVAVVLFPVFGKSREKARQTSCLSNVRQIMTGMLAYAQDYSGHLPSARDWQKQLHDYTKNAMIFECPNGDPKMGRSYAMNRQWSGAELDSIPDKQAAVIVYEADDTGAPALRHNGGMNVGYADGHAKMVREVPPGLLPSTSLKPPSGGYGLADELKVSYEAQSEVWVASVHEAVLGAEQAVQDEGGFVLASRLQATADPPKGEVVCRVPRERVGDAVNAFGALGWVATREIAGEDLTARYLAAQRTLATDQGREERLRESAKTAKQPQPASADRAKADEARKAQDNTRGELFNIASATDLATVSARFLQRSETPPPEGLGGTWTGAASAAGASVGWLLRVCIWLLLFAWLWAPPLGVAWLVRRRRSAGAAR